MIVTDEHNLRTLGCYREYFDKLAKNLNLSQNQTQSMIWGSNNVVETPHIDSLAREGVLFTNFYTVSPLCTPSRASFMSGLYPQFTGLPMIKQNNGRMDDKVVTFAETLQKQGNYSTAYLGKWHLDGDTKPGWRSDSSPKRQFGFQDNKFAFNRGHWKYLAEVDGDMKAYTFNDREQFKDKEEENFTTDYLFDRSIEIIKQNQKKAERQPFVHVISIPDPHGPNQVRQPYQKKYKDMSFELPYSAKAGLRKDPAVPAWVRTFGSIGDGVPLNEVDEYIKEYESRSFFQNSMQQYFGMVKCIDDNVGKLLQYLKATGIDNETIIV
jgi:arylsulfatase A-like enzyme